MKFGIIELSQPDKDIEVYPYQEVHERVTKEIIEADKDGYDYVWIAEHHFSTYSVCPSIHMMGAHFAANTKNLRIGTGGALAACYNPLRLAEEVWPSLRSSAVS